MKRIAHRGGAGLRVENTLVAFEHAIDLGADGAELDVHLTRDGQVIVHHNDRLNGAYCRDEHGRWLSGEDAPAFADLTLDDLWQYDIGVPDPDSAYARRFDRIQPVPGQHVPTLREVIGLVKSKSRDFWLVIEIKTSLLEAADKPWRRLVDATLEVVREEGFAGRSVFCSFDWGALRYARQQQPDLKTWFTVSPLSWLGEGTPPAEDIPPCPEHLEAMRALHRAGDAPWFGGFDPRGFEGGYPEAVAAVGGDAWFMYYRDCTREICRDLAGRGLHSAAWSVNLRDEQALQHLLGTGLEYLALDYPDMTQGLP